MNNKLPNDPLSNFFHKNLEGHREDPPDELWNLIEGKIPPKPVIPTRPDPEPVAPNAAPNKKWLFLGIFLFFLGFLASYLLFNNLNTKSLDTNASKKALNQSSIVTNTEKANKTNDLALVEKNQLDKTNSESTPSANQLAEASTASIAQGQSTNDRSNQVGTSNKTAKADKTIASNSSTWSKTKKAVAQIKNSIKEGPETKSTGHWNKKETTNQTNLANPINQETTMSGNLKNDSVGGNLNTSSTTPSTTEVQAQEGRETAIESEINKMEKAQPNSSSIIEEKMASSQTVSKASGENMDPSASENSLTEGRPTEEKIKEEQQAAAEEGTATDPFEELAEKREEQQAQEVAVQEEEEADKKFALNLSVEKLKKQLKKGNLHVDLVTGAGLMKSKTSYFENEQTGVDATLSGMWLLGFDFHYQMLPNTGISLGIRHARKSYQLRFDSGSGTRFDRWALSLPIKIDQRFNIGKVPIYVGIGGAYNHHVDFGGVAFSGSQNFAISELSFQQTDNFSFSTEIGTEFRVKQQHFLVSLVYNKAQKDILFGDIEWREDERQIGQVQSAGSYLALELKYRFDVNNPPIDFKSRKEKTRDYKNAIIGEVGGVGSVASINYERYFLQTRDFKLGLRAGFFYTGGQLPSTFSKEDNTVFGFPNQTESYVFPTALSFYLGQDQQFLQVGIGQTFVRALTPVPNNLTERVWTSEKYNSLILGYRFEARNRLVYHIQYNLMADFQEGIYEPWGALGIGYMF